MARSWMAMLAISAVAFSTPVWAQGQTGSAAPPSASTSTASPSGPGAAIAAPSYLLGSGDHVRVTVFGEPDLSGEFQIGPAGTVALPLVGEVPAQGLTTSGLQDALTAAYKKGLLVNPRVSVELLTFRPFFILGEVQKPGSYPYTSDLTVFNAVATAGGFTYRANQKWVYIRHANEDKEVKLPLTSSTPLEPGDTAIIKQRYF